MWFFCLHLPVGSKNVLKIWKQYSDPHALCQQPNVHKKGWIESLIEGFSSLGYCEAPPQYLYQGLCLISRWTRSVRTSLTQYNHFQSWNQSVKLICYLLTEPPPSRSANSSKCSTCLISLFLWFTHVLFLSLSTVLSSSCNVKSAVFQACSIHFTKKKNFLSVEIFLGGGVKKMLTIDDNNV